MNRTMSGMGWMGCVGLLACVAVQACSADPAATPGTGTGETPDGGPPSTNDDGGIEGGLSGCAVEPDTETFGLSDATKLVSLVSDEGTSLPANARADNGRLIVDACGFRLLANLEGTYSIHTGGVGKPFTALSTASIEGIRSVEVFRKIGPDFAVLATTQDNKTYLYRMPGEGGPLTKVVSTPLLANGDFGAQSIAVSETHLFFSSYKSGPMYELRRTPIANFAAEIIPLEEPIKTDSGDNARERVFVWGGVVSYGFGHYAQDCTPSADVGCTAQTIGGAPNLRYVFAGHGDALYGWMFGDFVVRRAGAAANVEGVPSGITTTSEESLVASSVAPDGERVALVTQSPTQGLRLLLVTNAKGDAPNATAVSLTGVDRVRDVWTNGKVALLVVGRDSETKPLTVQGIAWP